MIQVSSCLADLPERFHFMETLQFLVDKGLDVNSKNPKGETALMLATGIDKIRFLLKNRADVNVRDNNGFSVLARLCKDGHFYGEKENNNMINILLENGANISDLDELLTV